MTGFTTNAGIAFADVAEMQTRSLKANTMARLITGERYSVLTTNLGSGVILANGNFANPLADAVTVLNSNTILIAGGDYISANTATHTVPSAGNVGNRIKITWLDGDAMTLSSVSNITVTKDTKTTDDVWVFEDYIQQLVLVDNGTEWEIK